MEEWCIAFDFTYFLLDLSSVVFHNKLDLLLESINICIVLPFCICKYICINYTTFRT